MNRRDANAEPNELSRNAAGSSRLGTPPARETAGVGPATRWRTPGLAAGRRRNWVERAEVELRRVEAKPASPSEPSDRIAAGPAERLPETGLLSEQHQDRSLHTRVKPVARPLREGLPRACLPSRIPRSALRVAASATVGQGPVLAASARAGRPSVLRAVEPPSAPRKPLGSDTRRPPGERQGVPPRRAREPGVFAAPRARSGPI